jgi:ferredoxin/flavodoxin---NADP+ reductase
VLVSRKPTGTLVLDDLRPGKHLYLFGTGTGLAPFLSIVKDPETYERFEKVVLVHGVREVSELAYGVPAEELPATSSSASWSRSGSSTTRRSRASRSATAAASPT